MEKNAEPSSSLSQRPDHGRQGLRSRSDDNRTNDPSRAPGRLRHRLIRIALVLLLAWLVLFVGRRWDEWARPSPPTIRGVLPGEFERCAAILLTPTANQGPLQSAVFAEMAAQASRFVDVYVLVSDEHHRKAVAERFQQADVAVGRVHFLNVRCASPWVRDFGPLVVDSFEGGFEFLSFHPTASVAEPSLPQRVAAALGLSAVTVPLVLDGGNMLSNGAGLCVSSTALQAANPKKSREEIASLVRKYLGGDQLILLEPLAGESTKHVDMFCAFTAPDTIVVAACDPAVDPHNAAILDRNAEQLRHLRTRCGPLKIERIPLPPSQKKYQWATYTNVVFANGVLLVPSYAGVDPAIEQRVLATYRRLLPTWKVQSIDSTQLLRGMGSLHCAAMNLYGTGRPKVVAPSAP